MANEKSNFSFQEKSKSFDAFNAQSMNASFQKWGFTRHNLQVYEYDKYFDINFKEHFVHNFFTSLVVQTTFKTFSREDHLVNFSQQVQSFNEEVVPVVEVIPASVTNMNFFAQLQKCVARDTGDIRKCFDEVCGDFLVSDELRKLLLSEESDFYTVYSDEQRKEFLFRLFTHLVLGGYCCQYEDNINQYIDSAKYLYKDLLSVQKDKNLQKLYINCVVLRVTLKDSTGKIIFPGSTENVQNFCYLIIEPERRQVVIWHHIWSLDTN